MKKYLLGLLLIVACISAQAQGNNSPRYYQAGNLSVNKGINQYADSSAYLEIGNGTTDNKGIMFPRVNNTSTVVNPKRGLVVFDKSDNGLKIYTGSAWASTGSGGGGVDVTGIRDTMNTLYDWYNIYNDTIIICAYWQKAGVIVTLPFDTVNNTTPGNYYFRSATPPQLAAYSLSGGGVWSFAAGYEFDRFPYGNGYPRDTINYGGHSEILGTAYFDTTTNGYYSISSVEICDTTLPTPLAYEFEGAMYMYKNKVRFGDHYTESNYEHDLADFDFDTRWFRKGEYSKLGMTVATETNSGVGLVVNDLSNNQLAQISLKDVRYASVESPTNNIQANFSNGYQSLFFGTNGAPAGFEQNQMRVIDNTNSKGLENYDDYSGNFTSNSLITKIYGNRLSDTTIFITRDSILKYGVAWILDNPVTSYRVYNINVDRSGYDDNGGSFGIRCLTPFLQDYKVHTYNITMTDTSHKAFYVSFNQTNGVDDMSINNKAPLYIFSQPFENASFRAQSQISKNMLMTPLNREVSIIRPLPSAAAGTIFAFTDNKNYLPFTYIPTSTDFDMLGTNYDVEIVPLNSDGLSIKSNPYFISGKTSTGNFTLNYTTTTTVVSGGMVKIIYRFKYMN